MSATQGGTQHLLASQPRADGNLIQRSLDSPRGKEGLAGEVRGACTGPAGIRASQNPGTQREAGVLCHPGLP